MLYSVIVPIYNREKSIRKCIDSILNQTESDFELILVDDGSIDNSGRICDKYKKLDERVVVIHKANGGVSSARNTGIDIAQGKYIVFVDSDDYVDETYLESFNNIDDDLVISGVIRDHKNDRLKISDEEVKCNDEGIIHFMKGVYSSQPIGKRFTREIIIKSMLRFNTMFNYGEDSLFCAEYLKHCNKMKYINKYTYHICDVDANSLGKISNEEFIDIFTEIQNCIYNYYFDRKKVQNYLINKYLWYVEKTINEISIKEIDDLQKKEKIDNLIKSKHFKLCLKNYKQAGYSISLINMICYKFGLTNVILYRMKKSSEKREK